MKEISGLSNKQVQDRKQKGLSNNYELNKTKSYAQIFKDNIFTLFNFINIVIAILVFFTGSYKNLLFLGVVISNAVIGIFQEIRAKKTLDKINLIAASKVEVIRENQSKLINIEDVVLDDVMVLKTGNQIIADGKVIDGYIEVDESLLTGESDIIKKEKDNELFSGSFVVSGNALCLVTKVGKESYAAKISANARVYNKYPSELRDTLNKIIKYIGIAIIPIGLILFAKDYFYLDNSFNATILSVSASLIGMIPEGLVILTSIALAVGVIHLANHKTLVQELYCIETLARVDTLCLDKTGTITEGKMLVNEYIKIKDVNYEEIIGNMLNSLNDINPTIDALRDYFKIYNNFHPLNIVPFSSIRKYSGVNFEEGNYIFGAYEFINSNDQKVKDIIDSYATLGKRVLCFGKAKNVSETSVDDCEVLGLIIIADKIRESAYETLDYFKKQGVDIKIISGDNPLTVSEVASRAGVNHYEKYIDASTLKDEEIDDAVNKYSVFGRVSPKQKELMVIALKKAGHVVGMSGDGVNDVLAFKKADVSIAMASGSDIAKNCANLVLLDSDFDALPYVLNEGRRVINNIQKVATLFLTKTLYSCILSLLLIILPYKYPFIPIHLTFVSSLTIGIPSFFLALEPNYERVKGNLLDNVIKISLPAALGVIIALNYNFIVGNSLGFAQSTISTLSVIALCTSGLVVLFKCCLPFSKMRIILYILMFILVFIGFIFGRDLLSLTSLNLQLNLVHIIINIFIVFLSFLFFKQIIKYLKK